MVLCTGKLTFMSDWHCRREWCLQAAVECKLTVDMDDYVSSFRPELMEFAADWAQGARFVDIQQRSDFFEVPPLPAPPHTQQPGFMILDGMAGPLEWLGLCKCNRLGAKDGLQTDECFLQTLKRNTENGWPVSMRTEHSRSVSCHTGGSPSNAVGCCVRWDTA